MLFAQAADARVFFFFKDENGVNDRNMVLDLNLCQRVSHAPANVLRMACLALKDHTQANDGVEWSVKLGPEAHTEVVLSRVLSAVGYHQPPVYYLPAWQLGGGPMSCGAM